MRRRRHRGEITVRIMWSTRRRQGEAERVAEAIMETLKRLGYTVKESRAPNRKNSGGRIYFTLLGKRRGGDR